MHSIMIACFDATFTLVSKSVVKQYSKIRSENFVTSKIFGLYQSILHKSRVASTSKRRIDTKSNTEDTYNDSIKYSRQFSDIKVFLSLSSYKIECVKVRSAIN